MVTVANSNTSDTSAQRLVGVVNGTNEYKPFESSETTILPNPSDDERSADDAAAYILSKTGLISAMKLQKLLYYSQAWSLVWDDRCLFQDRIEAWANGPVIPSIYEKHIGLFQIAEWSYGNPNKLDDMAKETIDVVLEYYAHHNAQWLSDLTNSERPWREARLGLAAGERGNSEISLAVMMEYYSSLSKDHAEETSV